MKCNQKECKKEAVYEYVWPGKTEYTPACGDHFQQAQNLLLFTKYGGTLTVRKAEIFEERAAYKKLGDDLLHNLKRTKRRNNNENC